MKHTNIKKRIETAVIVRTDRYAVGVTTMPHSQNTFISRNGQLAVLDYDPSLMPLANAVDNYTPLLDDYNEVDALAELFGGINDISTATDTSHTAEEIELLKSDVNKALQELKTCVSEYCSEEDYKRHVESVKRAQQELFDTHDIECIYDLRDYVQYCMLAYEDAIEMSDPVIKEVYAMANRWGSKKMYTLYCKRGMQYYCPWVNRELLADCVGTALVYLCEPQNMDTIAKIVNGTYAQESEEYRELARGCYKAVDTYLNGLKDRHAEFGKSATDIKVLYANNEMARIDTRNELEYIRENILTPQEYSFILAKNSKVAYGYKITDKVLMNMYGFKNRMTMYRYAKKIYDKLCDYAQEDMFSTLLSINDADIYASNNYDVYRPLNSNVWYTNNKPRKAIYPVLPVVTTKITDMINDCNNMEKNTIKVNWLEVYRKNVNKCK